ncbi:hypothetical protein Golob_012935, partial [Gossypium lobatum]|nr:hypothetical protein [Gossypium lobatum]
MLIWRGEPSRDFSMWSAYKPLQDVNPTPTLNELQTKAKDFYKKLWSAVLMSRILTTSFVVALFQKRHGGYWVFMISYQRQTRIFFEWLSWVFNGCSATRRRVLCVALWRLWTERNKKLHERVSTSGRETVKSISCYIKELEIEKERVVTNRRGVRRW